MVRLRANRTACAPCCAVQHDGWSSSGLMARQGLPRAPCHAGPGTRTVWFGAVGTARTLCHTGSRRQTVCFSADGTGMPMLCALRVRMDTLVQGGWHDQECRAGSGGRSVWFGINSMFGTARTVPCGFGRMNGPIRDGWHCPCTVPCSFGRADGRSGSGPIAQPGLHAHRAVWVWAE